jgi:hypothetical protein
MNEKRKPGNKSKPWSKLKREIMKLITPGLGLQIHCVAYRMDSQWGNSNLPRYWITLDKETIFDFPKQFVHQPLPDSCLTIKNVYPYGFGVSDISELIREYINSPKDGLLEKHFESDIWRLTDILKAADKRIGKDRLTLLHESTKSKAVNAVIEKRRTL